MNTRITLLFIAALAISASNANAWEGPYQNSRAASYLWHHDYYHTMWGEPVALVVPPTVEHETIYSWGVPATRVKRVDHQFQRPYPGPYRGGYVFQPTPYWPTDTRQFGIYPIRGPW